MQTDEVPAWDALSQGRVDAILEDWGHPEQEQRYVQDKKTIAPGGDLGGRFGVDDQQRVPVPGRLCPGA